MAYQKKNRLGITVYARTRRYDGNASQSNCIIDAVALLLRSDIIERSTILIRRTECKKTIFKYNLFNQLMTMERRLN